MFLSSLSLSECWNEGFTGAERLVIILTIIALITAYGIKEHPKLKKAIGVAIVAILAIGIFSCGGGGKEGLHAIGACLVLGGVGGLFLDWILGRIEDKSDVIPYIITAIIGIIMSGVISL